MSHSKKPTSASKLGIAELVLAYELRQEGIRRKIIARALGVNVRYLNVRLRRCEREGISCLAN